MGGTGDMEVVAGTGDPLDELTAGPGSGTGADPGAGGGAIARGRRCGHGRQCRAHATGADHDYQPRPHRGHRSSCPASSCNERRSGHGEGHARRAGTRRGVVGHRGSGLVRLRRHLGVPATTKTRPVVATGDGLPVLGVAASDAAASLRAPTRCPCEAPRRRITSPPSLTNRSETRPGHQFGRCA